MKQKNNQRGPKFRGKLEYHKNVRENSVEKPSNASKQEMLSISRKIRDLVKKTNQENHEFFEFHES